MKATEGPLLVELENCWIEVTGKKILLRSLPEISDSKSASYNDEPIIGRSFPMKTYSHSENRSISVTFHFYVVHKDDVIKNISDMRAIQSALYPRVGSGGAPFIPPPVCRLYCGSLLGDAPLCVVLRRYTVKFPTEVAWDEVQYTPWKFDLDTEWDVVYKTSDLPGQERIFKTGR